MDKRFKLRSQDDVHENERQHKGKQEVKASLAHLLRLAHIARLISGREFQFLDVSVYGRGNICRRSAWFCIRKKRYLALPVSPIDRGRARSRGRLNNAVERYPAELRRRHD